MSRAPYAEPLPPENIAWGTAQQNADDMREHGTVLKGESTHRAKLTADSVRTIRRLLSEGRTAVFVARLFGVTPETIGHVARRRTWKHI